MTGEPEEGFGFGTFLLYLKHTRPSISRTKASYTILKDLLYSHSDCMRMVFDFLNKYVQL